MKENIFVRDKAVGHGGCGLRRSRRAATNLEARGKGSRIWYWRPLELSASISKLRGDGTARVLVDGTRGISIRSVARLPRT